MKTKQIQSQQWVNNQRLLLQQILCEGNKIFSNLPPRQNFTFVISEDTLTQRFSLKLELNNTFMAIGIADIEQSLQQNIRLESNRIVLNTKGDLYDSGVLINQNLCTQNLKFIHMQGDLQKGWISWKNQQKTLCFYQSQKLKNNNIKWAFYIYLTTTSNIKLIQSWPSLNIIPIHNALALYQWDYDILYELYQILEG